MVSHAQLCAWLTLMPRQCFCMTVAASTKGCKASGSASVSRSRILKPPFILTLAYVLTHTNYFVFRLALYTYKLLATACGASHAEPCTLKNRFGCPAGCFDSLQQCTLPPLFSNNIDADMGGGKELPKTDTVNAA